MQVEITYNKEPINDGDSKQAAYLKTATKVLEDLGDDTATLMNKWNMVLDITNQLPPTTQGRAEGGHWARLSEKIMDSDQSTINAIAFEEINHCFDSRIGFSDRTKFHDAVNIDSESLEAKVLIAMSHIWDGSFKSMSTDESYTNLRATPAAEVLVDIGHCDNMLDQVTSADEFMDRAVKTFHEGNLRGENESNAKSPESHGVFDLGIAWKEGSDSGAHFQTEFTTREEIDKYLEDAILGYSERARNYLKKRGVDENSPEYNETFALERDRIKGASQTQQAGQIQQIKDLTDAFLEQLDDGIAAKHIMTQAMPHLFPQYQAYRKELETIAHATRANISAAGEHIESTRAAATQEPEVALDPSNADQVSALLTKGVSSQQLASIVDSLPERDPTNAEQGRAFNSLRAALALHRHATGEDTSIPLDEAAKNEVARGAVVNGKRALDHANATMTQAIARERYEVAAAVKKVKTAIETAHQTILQ